MSQAHLGELLLSFHYMSSRAGLWLPSHWPLMVKQNIRTTWVETVKVEPFLLFLAVCGLQLPAVSFAFWVSVLWEEAGSVGAGLCSGPLAQATGVPT